MVNSKALAEFIDSAEAGARAGIVRETGEMCRSHRHRHSSSAIDSMSPLTGVDFEGPAEAERGVA
ncbi:hypothetical protein P9A14_08460 [Gordonia hongkongensis]|uniref:Uncharacterized protein n=1 Tax=Gordonia hongkongensis TaxID=1701090 RepID=A0AAX3TC58_9ACTN|nr:MULTISPECIES: hypothetical protein [Gordonia]QIK48608.1 hypothetical protein G8C36_16280 [Gordonia terrae]MBN0971273.1 hypothetical protein [Gordonia sp. BP-119]MBN0983666.1 hypothetical protein [Gordonia sp. BP-94]WFP26508.1 hypothetical protein P9A14_08460 [Gordonia hongkongensis]WGJ87184.1 hypothetical protein QAD21_08780 [Gordonia sp. SMJS1]